jgi:rare lipoprotein A
MTNGERFDRRSFTAASRSLPLGTRIRVFNLENGKFVDVTVTDRGPARFDRILDLSEASARQLKFAGEGVARVFFFVLPEPETVYLDGKISDTYVVSVQ